MSEEALETLKAKLDNQVESLVAQYKSTPREELAEPDFYWDILATGPFNLPPPPWPGPFPVGDRIIQVGEVAYFGVVVFLNPSFPAPQSACSMITDFGASIELNMVTSNMQTMSPAPSGLNPSVCIPTSPNVCTYNYIFEVVPQQEACLYETNICARICNCNHKYVRSYSAFARWVVGIDFDAVFGSPSLTFDHPIRYMVSNLQGNCCP